MSYQHGIYIREEPTKLTPPVRTESAVQVVVGVAPINMGEHRTALEPKIAYTYAEAVKKMGMSKDLEAFTICQSIKASFLTFSVAPIVFINVLDPVKHKKSVEVKAYDVSNKEVVIAEEGILLNTSFVLSVGQLELTKDEDYTAEFTNEGYVKVKFAESFMETQVSIAFEKIDATAVTTEDIVKGVQRITDVYPLFNVIPALLLAPGYSHMVEVYNALITKTTKLNSIFTCCALVDADTEKADTYDKVKRWKDDQSIINEKSILCWPMIKVGEDIIYMSAMLGALIAETDNNNEGVPFVSPSNKPFRITGICTKAGKQIILDLEKANALNGAGVVTAINMNGWRAWGNRTAAYPGITDPKDTFIPNRRLFSWIGNTFILNYFARVDNPLNKRAIESLVDSENMRLSALKARGQIIDAKIEYNAEDNPTTDLVDGKIRFKQKITPAGPMESITNTLEFDTAPLALEFK